MKKAVIGGLVAIVLSACGGDGNEIISPSEVSKTSTQTSAPNPTNTPTPIPNRPISLEEIAKSGQEDKLTMPFENNISYSILDTGIQVYSRGSSLNVPEGAKILAPITGEIKYSKSFAGGLLKENGIIAKINNTEYNLAVWVSFNNNPETENLMQQLDGQQIKRGDLIAYAGSKLPESAVGITNANLIIMGFQYNEQFQVYNPIHWVNSNPEQFISK